MLHAICAEDVPSAATEDLPSAATEDLASAAQCEAGKELWGFIPPFIASVIPEIINPDYDGTVDGNGGTNPIFGVDGSPVAHDVFIEGYDVNGEPEGERNWHTILFVPYGRGGAGFSILDVTDPKRPLHMVSIYNDYIGKKVLISDVDGEIETHAYSAGSMSVGDSLEGKKASANLADAQTTDGGDDSDTMTAQDLIAVCQSNDDVTEGDFHAAGTASCYTGTTFTFEGFEPDALDGINVSKSSIRVTERVNGTMQAVDFASATFVNSQFVLTFDDTKVFNRGGSENEIKVTNNFNVSMSCTTSSGIATHYDYSQLGETWSAPRIFRIPAEQLDVAAPAAGESSAEDEYMALNHAGKMVVWLRNLFKEMGLGELVSKPTLMLGDNKQACRWSRTEMVTNGNRFIERQYHKVREFILAGDLETRYINTKLNVSDVFTKDVSREVIEALGPMLTGRKPWPETPAADDAMKEHLAKALKENEILLQAVPRMNESLRALLE